MSDLVLRERLEELAERGQHRGAEAVVAAAAAQVEGHRLLGEPRAPKRSRRPLVRRLAAAAAVVVVTLGTFVGAAVVYVREKLDDVTTVDLHGALSERPAAISDQPVTVLIVGSDARGGIDTVRGDTIIVLRLDPGTERVGLLSIPRDLWVPIAGQPGEQRINTALQHGPEVLVRTVTALLGTSIDHYVQVDFDGFRRAVNAVGGVDVPFPTPARDPLSGLDIPSAGCVHLDGDAALALVRSRHFQYLENGRWRTDPTGDLGRVHRQQEFLLQVFRRVASVTNPVELNRLLDVAADHLTVDTALSTGDLVDLAEAVRDVDAGDISFGTIGTVPTTVGGAAVLTATPEAVTAAVDQLHGRGPAPTSPVPPPPAALVAGPSC